MLVQVAMTRPKRSLVVVGDSETVRRYVQVPVPIAISRLSLTLISSDMARALILTTWGISRSSFLT